jgi:hypothetical protein
MAIDDIRPQDPSDQPQGPSPNDTTPPTQGHEQDQEDEQEDEAHDQEESNDQGEMRMMGIMEMRHHIQECAPTFNRITPSTTYLVILRKG